MPGTIPVSLFDVGSATSAAGALAVSGGPGVPAAFSPNYTLIGGVHTHSATADRGFCRILHNTGDVAPSTAPYGDSYEGYNFSGTVDNVYMRGALQFLKVAGYPAFWEQVELFWVTNRSIEYHWNYISIDGSVVYRPWGSALNVDTHTLDYFMQYLSTWQLNGIGTGFGQPNAPLLQWDGTSGTLNNSGGIIATSFAGPGGSLTGLNASNISGGTLADALFPSFMIVDHFNGRLALNSVDASAAYLTVQMISDQFPGIKVIGRSGQATLFPLVHAAANKGVAAIRVETTDAASYSSYDLHTDAANKVGILAATGSTFGPAGLYLANGIYLQQLITGDLGIVNQAGRIVMATGGSATSNIRLICETNGNYGFGSAPSYGSGVGVVSLANATTAPTTNPTGGGVLYVDSGALKYRGSSGTVTMLGAA